MVGDRTLAVAAQGERPLGDLNVTAATARGIEGVLVYSTSLPAATAGAGAGVAGATAATTAAAPGAVTAV